MTTANKGNIVKRGDLNRPMYNSEMDANLEEFKKLIDDVQALEENTTAVTKFSVGLGNVDNTSDALKPISVATQAALDTKLNASEAMKAAGGTMTGALVLYAGSTAPNVEVTDKSNKIANTRFVHNAIGVGKVETWMRTVPPAGRYLVIAGQTISRITYSDLFAAVGNLPFIGPGDGVTTFTLPNVGGLFPRYWDNGAGVDPGRELGSIQGHAVQNHNHYLPTTTSGTNNSAWGFKDSADAEVWTKTNMDRFVSGTEASTTFPNPLYVNGTSAGNLGSFANETRPVNIAWLATVTY